MVDFPIEIEDNFIAVQTKQKQKVISLNQLETKNELRDKPNDLGKYE